MKTMLASISLALFVGIFGVDQAKVYLNKIPDVALEVPEEIATSCGIEAKAGAPLKAESLYTVMEYRGLLGWSEVPAINECMVDYLVTRAQLKGHPTKVVREVEFKFMPTGAEYLVEHGRKK